jgi:ubiquinone/menaquinone biosynthesis C-methylase UbiE
VKNCFYPGRIDYEGAMARHFNATRAVSPDAQMVWRSAFQPYLGSAERVLDVGSGTGRFAVLIAEWFGAAVTGVEPASAMRTIAAVEGRHSRVCYVGGRAEQLPFREPSFDIALLSNVYHHISDRWACAQELRRVIRRGARLLIRGVFGDRIGAIALFDYFPEARSVCERFPTLKETIDAFTSSAFEFETVRSVTQKTASTLKELAGRTRLRADTTLALMTDEDFNRRQAALEKAAARELNPTPVLETLDLLVLRG